MSDTTTPVKNVASIVSSIYETVNTYFGINLIGTVSQNLVKIAPLFGLFFSLYLIFYLYAMYQRGLDDILLDSIKSMIGWFLVIAFAFNAQNYYILASTIFKAPEYLSSKLLDNQFDHKIFDFALTHLQKGIAMIYKAFNDASLGSAVLLGLALLIVAIIGHVGILVMLGMYLLAKVSLALVLMLGPLFIGFLLFSNTRQYGMNWIGQCFNYIVSCGLYATIIVIYNSLFVAFTQIQTKQKQITVCGGKDSSGAYISCRDSAPQTVTVDYLDAPEVLQFSLAIFTITALTIPLVMSIPSIASALTGGASISGHARLTPTGFLKNTFSSPIGPARSLTQSAQRFYARHFMKEK